MTAFYDSEPKKLEVFGNGRCLYRYDIRRTEGAEARACGRWKCEEVTVWHPLSSDRITEAVITERWDRNREQKLVNDFNAAKLGVMEEGAEAIEAYKAYLTERAALKAQVDADCVELGIR